MKIVVAADHAGFELKNILRDALKKRGHAVEDLGTNSKDSVDYPDFAHALARVIVAGGAERGVLVCGSGIGMSMAANRHAGVRAAVCRDLSDTKLGRLHNDANVLCIGARLTAAPLADEMVELFLATAFEGGRHQRRIEKIPAADR